MPYEITESRWLSPNVKRLVIGAPHVTHNCRTGQFVIVRATADAERIPLTIARSDRDTGPIVLIIQSVGAATRELCALEAGDAIQDVAGPLGRPTELHRVDHAVLVGGGVGTAVLYPQAQALADAGVPLITALIGGRTREHVILEDELSLLCDLVLPCTDDGSYGFHGLVTQRLNQLIRQSLAPVNLVLCAGPVPMMRAVANVTRPFKVRTIASLNPIMVDGTGMCGGCRVRVGGQTRFACVDGPEFDAHTVDFDELTSRLTAYRDQERDAMKRREAYLAESAS